jgi:hypothetical protein
MVFNSIIFEIIKIYAFVEMSGKNPVTKKQHNVGKPKRWK